VVKMVEKPISERNLNLLIRISREKRLRDLQIKRNEEVAV